MPANSYRSKLTCITTHPGIFWNTAWLLFPQHKVMQLQRMGGISKGLTFVSADIKNATYQISSFDNESGIPLLTTRPLKEDISIYALF